MYISLSECKCSPLPFTHHCLPPPSPRLPQSTAASPSRQHSFPQNIHPPTQGPKERLDDTVHAQPALLLADLAAAEALRARDPAAAAKCGAAAGLSLGEYAALVWAGALTFEDAIKARFSFHGFF